VIQTFQALILFAAWIVQIDRVPIVLDRTGLVWQWVACRQGARPGLVDRMLLAADHRDDLSGSGAIG